MGNAEQERFDALRAEAHELNGLLLRTKITVGGGGRKGPFTITVNRLGSRQVRKVIAAIQAALGEDPVEGL